MTKKNYQRKVYLMNHGYYRPKMYKSGKNWMIVGMTILSLMGGASMAQKFTAHADNINNKLNNQSNQQTNTNTNIKKPTINNIQSQANNLHNRIMNNNSAYQSSNITNQDNKAKSFIPQNSQERINNNNLFDKQSNKSVSNSAISQSQSTSVTYKSLNRSSNASNNSASNRNQISPENVQSNSNSNAKGRSTMSHKPNGSRSVKEDVNRTKSNINKKLTLNPITLGHGNLHQRITAHSKHFTAQQKPYVVQDDGNKYPYNSQTSRNFNGKYSDLVNKKQKAQINKSNQQAQYQMPMMKLRKTNQVDLGSFDKKQRKELNNVERVGDSNDDSKYFSGGIVNSGSDDGLNYKVYKNGGVEFTDGTAQTDLSDLTVNYGYIDDAKAIKFDNSIDTSDVTYMGEMFNEHSDLQTLTLPSSFDTSKVSNMIQMFDGNSVLQTLTLPKSFDTSNVTNMINMFAENPTLQTLTLPKSFDTSNVTDMDSMFVDDSSLQTLTIQSPKTKFNSSVSLPTMYKETGGKDSHGVPYTSATPNDFSKGNIGTFTTHKNVKKDQYVDVYNSTDKFTVPQIKSDSSLPSNWTFVSSENGDESKTPHLDSQGKIMIAPIYKGLVYKYNKSNNSIEFTNGTADSDLSYFTIGNPDVRNAQAIKFDSDTDTGPVTNMSYMFNEDSSLQSLTLPNSFDTSNVTDMSWMFANDSSLQSLTLPNSFDTSNVTNMSYMFNGDNKLQSLMLPNSFNTSNVTNMAYMFVDSDLRSLDLGTKFDTSKVTNMSDMFYLDSSLQSLTLPNSFDTSKVTNMNDMFYLDSSLQSLTIQSQKTKLNSSTDLPKMYKELTTNGGISDGYNVEKDSNGTPYTASDANNFNNGNIGTFITQLNKKEYKYSDVYNSTDGFLNNHSSDSETYTDMTNVIPHKTKNPYSSLPSDWTFVSNHNGTISNTPQFDNQGNIMIAPIYHGMVYRYNQYSDSTEFTNGAADSDLSDFDVGSITLDESKTVTFDNNIDTHNVRNMGDMFKSDKDVRTINFGNNFDTTNVNNMKHMFLGDTNLKSLNILSFKTYNVRDMSRMFKSDSSLSNINFPTSFDTRNVTNMGNMFASDTSLKSLDLSGFDTNNVKNMTGMFYGDHSLKHIKGLGHFSTYNVKDYSDMFASDYNLKSINLSNFYSGGYTHTPLANISGMFKSDKNITALEFPMNFHTDITTSQQTFSGMSNLSTLVLQSNHDTFGSDSGLPTMYKVIFGHNQNGSYTESNPYDFRKGQVGTYITKRNIPDTEFNFIYERDGQQIGHVGDTNDVPNRLYIENGYAYTVDQNNNPIEASKVSDSPENEYKLLEKASPSLISYSLVSKSGNTFYVTTPPITLHIRLDGHNSDLKTYAINKTNSDQIGRIYTGYNTFSDISFDAEKFYNTIKNQWNNKYIIDTKATNAKNGKIPGPNIGNKNTDNINHVYFPSAISKQDYYLELKPIGYTNSDISIKYVSPGDHSKVLQTINTQFNITNPNLNASDIINKVNGIPKGSNIVRIDNSDGSDIYSSDTLQQGQKYIIYISTPPIDVHYIYNGSDIAHGILSQDGKSQTPSALNGGTKINTDNKGNALSNLNSRIAQSILKGKAKNLQANQIRVTNESDNLKANSGDNQSLTDTLRVHYVTSGFAPNANNHEITASKDIKMSDGNEVELSDLLQRHVGSNDVPVKVYTSDNTVLDSTTDSDGLSDDEDPTVTLNKPLTNVYIKEEHKTKNGLSSIKNVNNKADTKLPSSKGEQILSPTQSDEVKWNDTPHTIYVYLTKNNHKETASDAVEVEYHEGSNNTGIIKRIPIKISGKKSSDTLINYMKNAKSNIMNKLTNGSIDGFNTKNFKIDNSDNDSTTGKLNTKYKLSDLEQDSENNQPILLRFIADQDSVTVKYFVGSDNNASRNVVATTQFNGVNDESQLNITLPRSDVDPNNSDKYPTNVAGLEGSDTTTGQDYYIPSDFAGFNIYSLNYGNYINKHSDTPEDFYDPSDGCYYIQVKPAEDAVTDDDMAISASIPTKAIKIGRKITVPNMKIKKISKIRNHSKRKQQSSKKVHHILGKSKYIYINRKQRK